ncbi:hypothetical protein EDC96DRAFT_599945 [Choanephora cucurbitarum]|nr:hypothetical protein EDC96DRAFT_547025 [Choanephora cucurbitarum]KAI8349929.1 hypothetical protein EDC96DRAFT_599945 [Choanephora cucurbitarum]
MSRPGMTIIVFCLRYSENKQCYLKGVKWGVLKHYFLYIQDYNKIIMIYASSSSSLGLLPYSRIRKIKTYLTVQYKFPNISYLKKKRLAICQWVDVDLKAAFEFDSAKHVHCVLFSALYETVCSASSNHSSLLVWHKMERLKTSSFSSVCKSNIKLPEMLQSFTDDTFLLTQKKKKAKRMLVSFNRSFRDMNESAAFTSENFC